MEQEPSVPGRYGQAACAKALGQEMPGAFEQTNEGRDGIGEICRGQTYAGLCKAKPNLCT